jgi:hypothetical protein
MPKDLVKVAPRSVKILFENDKLRILRIKFKKGQKIATHSHPPNYVYALTSARFKSIKPRGKSEIIKMKEGEGAWSDSLSHAVENLSDTAMLQIELKE